VSVHLIDIRPAAAHRLGLASSLGAAEYLDWAPPLPWLALPPCERGALREGALAGAWRAVPTQVSDDRPDAVHRCAGGDEREVGWLVDELEAILGRRGVQLYGRRVFHRARMTVAFSEIAIDSFIHTHLLMRLSSRTGGNPHLPTAAPRAWRLCLGGATGEIPLWGPIGIAVGWLHCRAGP
jgi:hypothetical protein